MTALTEFQTYADAQAQFTPDRLWELFDGNRDALNIAHECVDRHAQSGRDALIVVQSQGGEDVISYAELAAASSRLAHYLETRGVQRGDRVAIMLEPSRAFYTAMFGVIKRGAIAVPLFTLFGPDGIRLRVNDCKPALLITNEEKAATISVTRALWVCFTASGSSRVVPEVYWKTARSSARDVVV